MLGSTFVGIVKPVQAADITPSDLIALVNGIRTAYGLPALHVNSILMGTAQWTADEMVRTGIRDHLSYNGYPQPEDRMAAAGYGGGNAVYGTENWAGGYTSYITIGTIQEYWSDYWHMLPMTDANYIDIGAGVSVGSDGFAIYIVHAAYYAGGVPYDTPIPGENTTEPIQYVEPVVTATPNEDGTIIHRVEYGQTLFSIALSYGVSIDELKTLNNLSDNTIYVGQDLIIRIAPTATITPSATATRKYPTRTPTSSQRTPTATRLLLKSTPTPEPEISGSMPRIDRQWVGLGLLLVSAIGFFVVVFFTFVKPALKKSPLEEEPPAEEKQKKPPAKSEKKK